MARTLIVSDRHNSFFTANNIRVGNSLPTEGDFVKGDIIVNIGENTATEAMWICVESGNPGIWEVVGAGVSGGGSFVSINDSVLINEPVNEVSLEGLGSIITNKDKLIVHFNSTHLMEGVDYELSDDGTKIVKLTEGNWNESSEEGALFAFELFKGVESIDGDKIVVDSKLTSITNHVIIESGVSEVEIGVEGFNDESDMLMVFKNGVIMVEGVDYEVSGSKIVSTGEVWNENRIEEYGITFVVFKEVVEYNGEAEVKAENIVDGSIGMEKLTDDVKKAIENASNIDLSGYVSEEELEAKGYISEHIDISGKQDKSDEGLLTDDKTVIGAINELFQNANNGKELIANAIGEPLSSEDTFSAMSNDINGLLSTFKTNMMNNGVTVESSDKFKSLIDKIATMVEEGSGKGVQYTSGALSDLTFEVNGLTYYSNTVNVDFGFTPNFLFIEGTTIGNELFGEASKSILLGKGVDVMITRSTTAYLTITSFDATSIVFSFQRNTNEIDEGVTNLVYHAIGVGEEDTTLRDSLASILTEEGVSVSDEDDMASLITKVDEEFDKDNNTISELETDAENTRSTLANLMLEGGYDIVGDEDITSLLDLLILSGIKY